MNINEEKTHIYEIMREITSERRKLTDIYYDLKNRLDQLHELEQRGLDNLSLKGYIDLHNEFKDKSKETAIHNIQREVATVIDSIKNDEEETKEDTPKKVVSNIDIELEKDKEPNKIGKHLNVQRIIDAMVTILKEEGKPLKIKKLHQKVCARLETDIKIANFRNNIINRAVKNHPKITRAGHGYYQYKLT